MMKVFDGRGVSFLFRSQMNRPFDIQLNGRTGALTVDSSTLQSGRYAICVADAFNSPVENRVMSGLSVEVKFYDAKGRLLDKETLEKAVAHIKKHGETRGYFVIAEFSGGASQERRRIEVIVEGDIVSQGLPIFVSTSPIP